MSKPLRILIVEDSEDDVFLLLHELHKGGYAPDYLAVCTAEAMSKALADRQWDIITSDYNMPGFSALAALKLLQDSGIDIPFIVVSGKIGEDQAVGAMKAGANDYVMKHNLSRLVPAIERELRDVEERRLRREAELALNRQFVQFKTIFDSLDAIVYVADLETYEIRYMNRYAILLFGEWEGKRCYDVLQEGGGAPCEFCTNALLVSGGVLQPPITYERKKSLNNRWYQTTDRAIEWTDGRLVKLQVSVDITEIKEMEQLKDEMISAVSHEMRTPLTAMLGFTEFLLENELDADRRRNILETIYKESERLNDLIGNFLDIQRTKGDAGLLAFDLLSVRDIFEQSARLFSCNNRIVIDCPESLPSIRGNEDKLHQVMINLLSNASKYSAPDSVIKMVAAKGDKEVIITVQDEGIGIPLEKREKVFERFYRVDNSDRRMIGGTGLGLALVKEIIAAHQGRIWIEPNSPVGSKVMFTLPCNQ